MSMHDVRDRQIHERSLELAALAVDFELSRAETAELEEHLATCATCPRRVAAMRRDAMALAHPLLLEPSSRVDAAVSARIARRPASPRRLVLIAAVVLLVLALLSAAAIGAYLMRTWPTQPFAVVPQPTPPIARVTPRPDASEPSPRPSASGPASSPEHTTTSLSPSGDPNINAPKVLIWNNSAEDRIEVSTYQMGARKSLSKMFELDVWPDPDRSAAIVVERQVLASPTGRLVAVAETAPQGKTRIRVVTLNGVVVWSTERTVGVPSLAWSADASQLAVAFKPEPWLVVGFPAGGVPDPTEYSLSAAVPLQLVGFAADGMSLLAYDGSGEAASWERPYAIDLARGTATRLDQFGGGVGGIAVSNTTTPSGLVDSVTGRVLDRGGHSRSTSNWSLQQGSEAIELGIPVSNAVADIQPRWADDGSIVVLETSLDDAPPSNDQKGSTLGLIRRPTAGAKPGEVRNVTWSYLGPFGTRSRGVLLDVRQGWALVGQYGTPSRDDPWLGFDEIGLVDMNTGRFGLMNLEGLGKRDIHVAGLFS